MSEEIKLSDEQIDCARMRKALELVRLYPDFDDPETPFAKMMDDVLAGRDSPLLGAIDSLSRGERPAAPAHADEPVARGWLYTTPELIPRSRISMDSCYSHGPQRPDERAGWIPLYAHPSAGIRSEWMTIETAPFEDVADSGKWLEWCLLGRRDAHGWVEWVGGMDADMWLHRDDTRACGDCETPTHWMPLPAPPRALGESS